VDMKGHLRTAALASVMTVMLCTAAAALAGTGVGGIFNLGQSNSVNATSTLTGSTAGPGLAVTNSSTGAGAAGLSLTTAAGKPPLTVSNTTKATNLNADQLDGLSSTNLSRSTFSSSAALSWLEDGRSTLRSVTLTAPQNGFVLLTGSALGYYGASGCAFCVAHLRFRDSVTGETGSAGDYIRSSAEDLVPLSKSLMIPASKGDHTYELIASWYDINRGGVAPSWSDATLAAVFLPFNGAGGTSVPAATVRSAAGGTAPSGSTPGG
jgi:hypothetical protein